MDKIKDIWNSFFTRFKENKAFRLKTIGIGAAALVLIIVLIVICVCAGGNEQPNTETTPTTDAAPTEPSTTETTVGYADYSVTVVDANGNPVTGIVVNFMNGDTLAGMQQTSEDGKAVKNLEAATYTVVLAFTDPNASFTYDTESAVVSAASTDLTIVVYSALGEEAKQLSVYDAVTDTHKEYTAYTVTTGSFQVNLNPDDRNYFIFMPTVDGVYEFSTDSETVTVGYYGAPHYIQPNNLADVTDTGSITSDIAPSMINLGAETGSATLVIGLDGNGVDSCVLTIKRIGDHIPTIDEYPWDVYKPTSTLSEFKLPQGVSLVDFDVTAKTEEYNIVFSEADGLYHLNTAEGPVIYVKLGVDSAYLASFQTIVDNSGITRYFFDEEGNFLKKESYTECVLDYIAVMDEETGVYPLTADLMYIIQQRGEYVGWWDYDSASFIFFDQNHNPLIGLNTEIAWLFACCYGEIASETPTEPEETEPFETEPVETKPVETEPIETQPDHEHKYSAKVTAPTCTEKGYTTYTCKCGDSYIDDKVDATGHNYKAVVTAPTTESKGYTTYTCKNCDDKYVADYVDKLPAATEPEETEPSFQLGKESKNDPVEVYYYEIAETMATTMHVKAGEYAKIDFYRLFDMVITIKSNDAYIVVGDGKNKEIYLPENGVLTYTLEYAPNVVMSPCSIWIGNAGKSDTDFTIEFSTIPGTQNNPVSLKLGDFTTKTTAGEDQGYYYIYKADKAGKLTVTFKSINIDKECEITLYNLITYQQLNAVNGTVTIDVNAGDEVQIIIVVADEDREFPAATIQATASFE